MLMLCDVLYLSCLLSWFQACEWTVSQSVCRDEFEASPRGTRCHGRLPLTGEAIALGITAIIQRSRGRTPGDSVYTDTTLLSCSGTVHGPLVEKRTEGEGGEK